MMQFEDEIINLNIRLLEDFLYFQAFKGSEHAHFDRICKRKSKSVFWGQGPLYAPLELAYPLNACSSYMYISPP